MVMVAHKARPGNGRQLFQHCNVPLLVVVNTLLLVYLVLTTRGGQAGGSSSHGSSMLWMSRGSAVGDESELWSVSTHDGGGFRRGCLAVAFT